MTNVVQLWDTNAIAKQILKEQYHISNHILRFSNCMKVMHDRCKLPHALDDMFAVFDYDLGERGINCFTDWGKKVKILQQIREIG